MGQKIRIARLKAFLTQEELAQKAGVEVSTVSRVERGVRIADLSVARLAAALGLDLEELLAA